MSGCHGGWCVRQCVRMAKWIPVLFITAIIVWSYYAYVVHVCLITVEEIWHQALLLLLYHFFLSMFVWSYWKTVFTPPGTVPNRFCLTMTELDRIETSDNPKLTLEQLVISKDLPCTMRTIQQEIRYCTECSQIKPDRAHHCGVCGQCVLKMDHHCPWVNNCVAFMNYKYFVLFLGYALTYCIYIALSTLQYFLAFWSTATAESGTSKFHILFLFFVSVMFSMSLASLFFYHLYLVSRNKSTLESFRTPIFRHGPDKKGFDLGCQSNIQEIFGDNKFKWFLPIFTSFGDGVIYPQRHHLDEEAGLLESNNGLASDPSPNTEERMPMIANESETTVDLSNSKHVSSSSGSESDLKNNGAIKINGAAREPRENNMALVNM